MRPHRVLRIPAALAVLAWAAALPSAGLASPRPPAPGQAAAIEFEARVVHVADGDTVTLLTRENRQLRVRLASIDAPESGRSSGERGRIGQPHAQQAKAALSLMIKGRAVRARCFDVDLYQRQVCELEGPQGDVGSAMVEAGLAWANTAASGRYLRDPRLVQLQEAARASGRGLWSDTEPVAPWIWRDQCWKQGRC